MAIEREKTILESSLPFDVYDQIRFLPDFDKRGQICEELFGQMFSLLDSKGVEVDLAKSGYRAKTDVRVMQKIAERNSFFFLRDIFGLWFVLKNETDRLKIPGIVIPQFPLTPEVFADGTPSVRDYSSQDVRSINRSRNKNISEAYSALHINGVFNYGGSRLGIFELKAFTEEEDRLYQLTRREYEIKRRNGRSNH